MKNDLSVGDRLVHPKLADWGLGQVIAVDLPNLTIIFEHVGEKKIRTDLIQLKPVSGSEAESVLLDAKLTGKHRTKRRSFVGSAYFNDGKGASRKKFIESLGASCANWNWSWSFINRDEKKIFFGAWKDLITGNRALILSEDWKIKNGKNRSSWPESVENLRLVEEEGYSLHVFTMLEDPKHPEEEYGRRKIGAILNDLSDANLIREGGNWYAVTIASPPLPTNV